MSYHPDDTICAIGTAAGGAPRGMIRISGPNSISIVTQLFEPADNGPPPDRVRHATALPGRMRIELNSSSHRLPCDLFLWPNQRSYTREPVAELHTIGSAPLLQAVLSTVCRAGARLAEPGEFTLRAFLAGRLDLTQAEAVLGVIDAAGADELDAALAQLAGGLARPLHQLREDLLQLLAELEAGLDFVDEDIRFVSQQEVLERLQTAGELLEDVASQMASRHATTHKQQVAIVGPPNVGKSSLFNSVVNRFGVRAGSSRGQPTAALVSPQRGTTRDYLTATISLDGVQCELVDTAGVEINDGNLAAPSIDSAAQSFAIERRKRATIRACCIAAPDVAASGAASNSPSGIDCELVVLTKSDLTSRALPPAIIPHEVPVVVTSSHTGEGLAEFCSAVRKLLTHEAAPQRGQFIAATAERCGESIRLSANALHAAAEIVKSSAGDELAAAELRGALTELGKVVGAVYTDDLLDRIFKTFCIGK